MAQNTDFWALKSDKLKPYSYSMQTNAKNDCSRGLIFHERSFPVAYKLSEIHWDLAWACNVQKMVILVLKS